MIFTRQLLTLQSGETPEQYGITKVIDNYTGGVFYSKGLLVLPEGMREETDQEFRARILECLNKVEA